ncbi:hypothetical protein H6790_00905 [Candidatus Nomurabacteria bacterium]|nr:hypothetical protein [Candidatus Nomurabacteria bacterium]MCB9820490.1 hypothetical protein [Candidatus Nomurabacteria bacterium]
MINLLPLEYKKKINKEIMERVVSIISFMVTIVFFVGALVAIPSLVFLSSQTKSAQAELSGVTAVFGEESGKSASVLIAERSELISYFFTEENIPLYPTEAFNYFIEDAGEGINITNLIYKPEVSKAGKDEVSQITYVAGISGTSDTRDELIKYRKKLESREDIASVDLPIGSLVEDKDIEFSITITFK